MISSIALSPDGITLAVAELGGGAKLWDTRSGSWLGSLPIFPESDSSVIKSLRFTSEDSLVGQKDEHIVEWNSRLTKGSAAN